MPGQTVTVVGHLRITDKPVKVQPYYWIGLIHEQVATIQDRIEPTLISVAISDGFGHRHCQLQQRPASPTNAWSRCTAHCAIRG
jgi:hypothetical protein